MKNSIDDTGKQCPICGSDNIRFDAYVFWDTENQCWEFDEILDRGLCLDCDVESIY